MLGDLLRFNRETTAMHLEDRVYDVTVGEFLDAGNYSMPFREWYLLPMAAAIWSVPERDVLDFPLPTFIRFCHHHGLLQICGRPQWRTVVGGARTYVDRIAAGLSDVRLSSPVRRVRRRRDIASKSAPIRSTGERFDQVVLACHSEQALACPRRRVGRGGAAVEEHSLLRPIASCCIPIRGSCPGGGAPGRAWNYLAPADIAAGNPVAVSYWLNRLQPLPFRTPLMITLNPPFEPRPGREIAEFEYSHPMVKGVSRPAQQRLAHSARRAAHVVRRAWMGHGFHEDGARFGAHRPPKASRRDSRRHERARRRNGAMG